MKVFHRIKGFLWNLVVGVAVTKDNLKNVIGKVVIIVVVLMTLKLCNFYFLMVIMQNSFG